jgi:hypothetical protein
MEPATQRASSQPNCCESAGHVSSDDDLCSGPPFIKRPADRAGVASLRWSWATPTGGLRTPQTVLQREPGTRRRDRRLDMGAPRRPRPNRPRRANLYACPARTSSRSCRFSFHSTARGFLHTPGARPRKPLRFEPAASMPSRARRSRTKALRCARRVGRFASNSDPTNHGNLNLRLTNISRSEAAPAPPARRPGAEGESLRRRTIRKPSR